MKKILLPILLMANLNSLAGTPITVGADNDNACDYHSIQDAIVNGSNDTIRIASNKNYFESIVINNVSKDLIGGYANCTQASMNITDLSKALLTGNGSDDVVTINKTNVGSSVVNLKNLTIANGNDGVYVNVQNEALGVIKLEDVRLFNNNAHGIYVFSFNGGNPVVSLKDTIVDFNQNSGVYCSGLGAEIRVGGDSLIEGNQAIQSGGGFHIRNECHADIYSPTIIRDNKAPSNGGGIYVSSQASAVVLETTPQCQHNVCLGEIGRPVIFEDNQADSDQEVSGNGGAIAVVGLGSEVTVFNGQFIGNLARNGGALSVSGGATMDALGYESPGQPCWSTGACLQFESNQASTGGVAYVADQDTEVNIVSAILTKNLSTTGVIAWVITDGQLNVFNSVIHNNGESGGSFQNRELFEVNGLNGHVNSNLEMFGVTIADNVLSERVIENKEGNLSISLSLIFDNEDVYAESGVGSNSHFECMIAHENSSFSAGGTISVVDRAMQPVFVNPAGANYHLRIDSPAIDYCYGIDGFVGNDIDYDTRGGDNLDVNDLHGTFDLGADEFNINNDIIFKHGFEQE